MANGWEMDVHMKIYNKLLPYVTSHGMTNENIDMYRNLTVPNKFPFIFVDLLPSVETGKDLEATTVNGGLFTFQIDVYSNTTAQKAKEIMMGLAQIMKKSMFEIIAMPTFDKDGNVHRCTARFRRAIDENDKI